MILRRLIASTVIVGALGFAGTASGHVRVTLLGHHDAVRAQTTTLIGPNGQPVGGRWQRWINEAKVPTYPGIEILDANLADAKRACVNATGCSAPSGPCDYSSCGAGHPETWLARDDTADTLYYEHGHIIDYMIATDADRAAFMRIWHLPGTVADWWRNETSFATERIYPPGELWSAAYELCAEGDSSLDSIRAAQGRSWLGHSAIIAQRQSCTLFRSL